jgi:hypothetical protein
MPPRHALDACSPCSHLVQTVPEFDPVSLPAPVKEYGNSQPQIPNCRQRGYMRNRSSQPGAPAARTVRGGVEPEAIAITETETYQTLLARAQRRTGAVPADRIVRHVLSITQGGDWPVQRDALEATLRRFASARNDEVQIVSRPPQGQLLGLYARIARRRELDDPRSAKVRRRQAAGPSESHVRAEPFSHC